MTSGSSLCSLSSEVQQELIRLQDSREKGIAIILKCSGSSSSILVEHVLANTNAKQIGEFLPDSSPRFVAIKFEVEIDKAHTQLTTALVYFSPPDTTTQMKLMYQSSKPEILKILIGAKEFELHHTADFTDEVFLHKMIGMTGKATDQLIGKDEKNLVNDSRRVSIF